MLAGSSSQECHTCLLTVASAAKVTLSRLNDRAEDLTGRLLSTEVDHFVFLFF